MKVDTPQHPVRFYAIQYYVRRHSTWLGILNIIHSSIALKQLKKHVGFIKQSVTIIEKIGDDTVLFEIKPQPNGIGRPSIEIYKRIDKI